MKTTERDNQEGRKMNLYKVRSTFVNGAWAITHTWGANAENARRDGAAEARYDYGLDVSDAIVIEELDAEKEIKLDA